MKPPEVRKVVTPPSGQKVKVREQVPGAGIGDICVKLETSIPHPDNVKADIFSSFSSVPSGPCDPSEIPGSATDLPAVTAPDCNFRGDVHGAMCNAAGDVPNWLVLWLIVVDVTGMGADTCSRQVVKFFGLASTVTECESAPAESKMA